MADKATAELVKLDEDTLRRDPDEVFELLEKLGEGFENLDNCVISLVRMALYSRPASVFPEP